MSSHLKSTPLRVLPLDPSGGLVGVLVVLRGRPVLITSTILAPSFLFKPPLPDAARLNEEICHFWVLRRGFSVPFAASLCSTIAFSGVLFPTTSDQKPSSVDTPVLFHSYFGDVFQTFTSIIVPLSFLQNFLTGEGS